MVVVLVESEALSEGQDVDLEAIKLDEVRLTYLLLWVAHTKRAWKDRCRLHFDCKSAMTPVKVIIQDAVESGKQVAAGQVSNTKRKTSDLAVAYLNLMAKQVNKEGRVRSYDYKQLVQGPPSHSATTQSRAESLYSQDSGAEEEQTSSGEAIRSAHEDTRALNLHALCEETVRDFARLGFVLAEERSAPFGG
ncbi:hypothetical protein R1sor_008088 [Riccia sorocarpa]|uniref:Uncharacterized protein n=1 Tax=Riccia sorocarpa TaxID=122646 RepID=A0ABD3HVU9_9MARC